MQIFLKTLQHPEGVHISLWVQGRGDMQIFVKVYHILLHQQQGVPSEVAQATRQ